jgi:hypothetical protein
MHFKNTMIYKIHQIVRSGGFLLLVGTLFSLSLSAQNGTAKEELPKDENGKYIYYEVVAVNDLDQELLTSRIKQFLSLKKLEGLAQDKDQTTAFGKFIITKTAFVLNHPSGEVRYNFVYEIKDQKYRFWLTNFVFIPYVRDRYANFVPATTKGTALESTVDKINSKAWNEYLDITAVQAKSFAVELKEYLAAKPKVKVQKKDKKVISTREW